MRTSSLLASGAAVLLVGLALAVIPSLTRPPTSAQAMPIPSPCCDPRTPIVTLPYVITRPGSYYLGRSLKGVAGAVGIDVQSDNVTIDLEGFTLVGGAGTLSGIRTASISSLMVRNGTIRGWGAMGIEANLAAPTSFEDLHILENGTDGLRSGTEASVLRCSVLSNGRPSAGLGIRVSGSSSVVDCIASGNGLDGISTADGCLVRGCTASGNLRDGILFGEGTTLVDCIARLNAGIGIRVGGSPGLLVRCHASKNGFHGIDAGDSSVVTQCISHDNGGDGFLLNDRVLITGCGATANTFDGIDTQHNCFVRGNLCSDNEIGIYVDNHRSRIEGNHCTQNSSYGIETTSGTADNLIICNEAILNGAMDYLLTPGNDYALPDPSPGANFTSDQPWTNFERQ